MVVTICHTWCNIFETTFGLQSLLFVFTSLHHIWQIITTISDFYSKLIKSVWRLDSAPTLQGSLNTPPNNLAGSKRGTS